MSTATVNTHIPQWDMADRMRKCLRESGISVQEIADEFGVSRNTIGTWINGRITPPPTAIRLWAIRFGVPLEWLVDGVGSPDGPDGGKLPHLDSNQEPFDYQLQDYRLKIPA